MDEVEAPLDEKVSELLEEIGATFPNSVRTGEQRLIAEHTIREWAWHERIPKGMPFSLGGPPGAGKSLLAHTIAMASSVGGELYGAELERGTSLYITCEDDVTELDNRTKSIAAGFGWEPAQLRNFLSDSWVGESDTRLVKRHQGVFLPTKRMKLLEEFINDCGVGLVLLDLVPDFWDGNEIVRMEVNAFVKGHLGSLAARTGAAIGILHHPSMNGIASGTGNSGSTSWEGSVRARMYLTGEDANGTRQFSVKKSNYALKGEPVNLKWDSGRLVPSSESYTDPNAKDGARQALGKHAAALIRHLKTTPSSRMEIDDRMVEYRKVNRQYRFRDALEPLLKRGLAEEVGGMYQLTEAGEQYLESSFGGI